MEKIANEVQVQEDAEDHQPKIANEAPRMSAREVDRWAAAEQRKRKFVQFMKCCGSRDRPKPPPPPRPRTRYGFNFKFNGKMRLLTWDQMMAECDKHDQELEGGAEAEEEEAGLDAENVRFGAHLLLCCGSGDNLEHIPKQQTRVCLKQRERRRGGGAGAR